MSFILPYLCKGGRDRLIDLPDTYLNFVTAEDVNQIAHGLHQQSSSEPELRILRNSTIQLAKQRKDYKHD